MKKPPAKKPPVRPKPRPPAPFAPPAPPTPRVAPPAPSAAPAAGMGITLVGKGGLWPGQVGGIGVLGYDLGRMLDFAKGVTITGGAGYTQGKIGATTYKIIPLVAGVTLDLGKLFGISVDPAISIYGGGSVNYPVQASAKAKGTIGGDVFGGVNYRIDSMNSILGEVGYGIVRLTNVGTLKGIYATVGYQMSL